MKNGLALVALATSLASSSVFAVAPALFVDQKGPTVMTLIVTGPAGQERYPVSDITILAGYSKTSPCSDLMEVKHYAPGGDILEIDLMPGATTVSSHAFQKEIGDSATCFVMDASGAKYTTGKVLLTFDAAAGVYTKATPDSVTINYNGE